MKSHKFVKASNGQAKYGFCISRPVPILHCRGALTNTTFGMSSPMKFLTCSTSESLVWTSELFIANYRGLVRFLSLSLFDVSLWIFSFSIKL